MLLVWSAMSAGAKGVEFDESLVLGMFGVWFATMPFGAALLGARAWVERSRLRRYIARRSWSTPRSRPTTHH